jgi:pyridinium-3,5-bisthiocarboxylic acid mononucleotide nickel chelatase
MSRVLYIDVIGGAAGDMLLAALLDAGAPIERVQAAVDAVLDGRYQLRTEPVRRGGFAARLLRVDPEPEATADHDLGNLLERLDRAVLVPRVARSAGAILGRLAKAEARIHGLSENELTLHAVGDDDTLIDIVGVTAALDALQADLVFVSSIPLQGGGGLVTGLKGHPDVPLPAPATLELLRGFAIRGEGSGETVTPTGAAILAALGTPTYTFPSMQVDAIGYGAGTRDPEDRANVIRVVLGAVPAEQTGAPIERALVVLEANLDDLTPELVADAAQALLASGALDVWTTPVQMKKGRPGVVLSALCEPQLQPRLREVFFEATSTLGVRATTVRRAELERRTVAVPLGEATVRVKLGLLRGRVVSATPEHDDVAALAARQGRTVRDVYDEAAAAARSLRYSTADE